MDRNQQISHTLLVYKACHLLLIAAIVRRFVADLLLLACAHELHDALGLLLGEGVIHRSERSFVDLHVFLSSRFNGLLCSEHKRLSIWISVQLSKTVINIVLYIVLI